MTLRELIELLVAVVAIAVAIKFYLRRHPAAHFTYQARVRKKRAPVHYLTEEMRRAKGKGD
jgi:hypothetical protein